MSPPPPPLLILLSFLLHLVSARILQLPVDTYAFPKSRVSFLNTLPLANETAQRWLRDGLRGGEREFLDQPWRGEDQITMVIGTGEASTQPGYLLEHMKLGRQLSYLCLIPPAVDHLPPHIEDISDTELTPIRSWSLLHPLSGTCLYHRQGWFTYSYCHNEQIRQFRELPHSHPHPPGGYKPEEDPDFEGYTLGRAPPTLDPGVDLTVAEQAAVAANLELAREAGSRYLVQRWTDGTFCEKAGKNREVEVQFHCSMTTTDTILFVKEAKTCSYILVVHTPRLCGEPGFRSPLDSREEAIVRCREIVDPSNNNAPADHTLLAEADQPHQLPRREPVLPVAALNKDTGKRAGGQAESTEDAINAMIQRALKALMSGQSLEAEGLQVIDPLGQDGVVLIPLGDDVDGAAAHDGLIDALRMAGFDIKEGMNTRKGEKRTTDDDDDDEVRHEL